MDDDLKQTVQLKRAADEIMPASTERFARFIVWALGGMGAVIVTVTIFVYTTKRDVADLKAKNVEIATALETKNKEVSVAFESIKARFATDDILHLGFQNQIKGNFDELKKREKQVSEVDDMWFMKEHGISNKEDFIQRHGYAAPTNPVAHPPGSPNE